jgi:gliding motility-associated-like protein
MRQLLISIFFLVGITLNGQINVSFSNAQIDPSGNGSVDVRFSNFTNITSFQHSINWDPNVVIFSSISNITTQLTDFNQSAITFPGSGTMEGQIAVAWFPFDGLPHSLPNNTRMFTINFTAVGNPCDSTFVVLSNTPTQIEASDENFNPILPVGLIGNMGLINLVGDDCDGDDDEELEDLQFIGVMLNAQPGEQICMPITVNGFFEIAAGQGAIRWDPTVLSFVEFRNVALQGFVGSTNQSSSDDGEIAYAWSDPNGQSVTLPDGSKLFDICFDVVGPIGSMSNVTLSDGVIFPNIPMIWNDDALSDVPFSVIPGKVTVVEEPTDPVIFNVASGSVSEGGNTCIDITVENFDNIAGIQLSVQWNPAVLTYTNTAGYNLAGLGPNNFLPNGNNQLRLSWNRADGQGQSLPDGSTIFQVCFDGAASCDSGSSSQVSIVNTPNFMIQVISGDSPPQELSFQINPGNVSINPCGISCDVVNTLNVVCNGAQTGAINVSLDGDVSNCNCVWKRNGVIFITLPASNCNLSGAPAGNYELELTCMGSIVCSSTANITEPTAIIIQETIKNVDCEGPGSITLNVSGGTPTYEYQWSQNAGGATTSMVNGLGVGTYMVTVTDRNDCTAVKSININESVSELSVTESISNVLCHGASTGSITINVTGGCPPLEVSGNLVIGANANLAAGSYNITITDSSEPANVVERSYTITQPAQPLTVTLAPTPSTGTNGTITANVSGGTAPYGSVWDDPNIDEDVLFATNLAPGTYSVTITDANGCTAVASTTVMQENDATDPVITELLVTSLSENNGFGVACHGDCNGTIRAIASGGVAPYTITVSGASTATINQANPGTFNIDRLCAGQNTITLRDSEGRMNVVMVMITTPERLVASSNILCEDGQNEDGSITLEVSGGVSPYRFEWSPTGASSQNLSNLASGTYSVLIEDANNCQRLLTNIRVPKCSDGECYETYTQIITPNNDGINDELNIRCAQDFPSEITIYDRWGNVVFNQPNYDNSWLGVRNDGRELPESAYMWVLTVNFGAGNREVYRGTVTLLRN